MFFERRKYDSKKILEEDEKKKIIERNKLRKRKRIYYAKKRYEYPCTIKPRLNLSEEEKFYRKRKLDRDRIRLKRKLYLNKKKEKFIKSQFDILGNVCEIVLLQLHNKKQKIKN